MDESNLKSMAKKYTVTLESASECEHYRGHKFERITDDKIKKDIRLENPKMTCLLWSCKFCNVIIETT